MSDGGAWPARFELAPQPLRRPLFIAILLQSAALIGMTSWILHRYYAAGTSPPRGFWIQTILLLVGFAPLAALVFWRRRGPAWIEVTPECVSMPSIWAPGRFRERPISALRSAFLVPSQFGPSIYFGFETGMPTSIRCKEFRDPADPQRLLAALERAVAERPDGAALLARIASQRALVGSLRGRIPWFVVSFLAAITLIFGATCSAGLSDPRLRDVVLLHFGASEISLMRAGEWHRLVTANLLHLNGLHFASNAFLIGLLGFFLERQIGMARAAIVGLTSGVGGAALSHVLRGGGFAVGASTVGMGMWAAWLLLLWRRREEFPHRTPVWTIALPVAAMLLGEFQTPNIDHAGHAGGAVAGVACMALLMRGRDLAALAAPAPRLTPLALVIAAPYLLGAGIVARDVAGWSESHRLALAMRAFEREGADPELCNLLAWYVARSPTASPRELEAARARMRTTAVPDGAEAEFLDTRALLAHRLGRSDEAVELQRLADDAAGDRRTASRLALYEWEKRRSARAPQRIGADRADVAIALDAAREGEEGEQVIAVEIAGAPAAPLEVHAVALAGDSLRGHLRLQVGPNAPRSLRFADADSDHNSWRGVRFEVTRIDATRDLPAAAEWRWRLWRIDPDALAY